MNTNVQNDCFLDPQTNENGAPWSESKSLELEFKMIPFIYILLNQSDKLSYEDTIVVDSVHDQELFRLV